MTPQPVALAGLLLLFGGCALIDGAAQPQAILAAPFLPPSTMHPLGTDDLGRDMLTLVAAGALNALHVAGLAVPLALVVGTLWGMAAGLSDARGDAALMRTADIVAALPVLLLAILLAALHGPSVSLLGLLLGLTRWPLVARLVRAEVHTARRADYLRAARALGVGPRGLLARHLLPAALRPARVSVGILFGGAILAESALAFVGLGDAGQPSWGRMIAAGFAFLDRAVWVWAAPAAALVLAAGLAALLGERRTPIA
jgi:peptide/nickel transport system permease protein